MGVKLGGKILGMLEAGTPLKSIANILGKSYQSIYKKVKRYERAGVIECVCKYPLKYHKKKNILPHTSRVGDFTQPPTIFAIKFGASFHLIGRPNIIYNRQGIATIKEVGHTIRFGRYKTTIWVFNLFGTEYKQILTQGKLALASLSKHYSRKFNVRLTLIRIFEDIEWGIESKDLSKKTAQKAGIGKGGKIEVAGALHKFRDFSHPENFQINALPNGVKSMPTHHIQIHQYLYEKLPSDIQKILELIEKTALLQKNQTFFNKSQNEFNITISQASSELKRKVEELVKKEAKK